MKKKIMIGLVAAAIATSAQAGVAEKKAKRAAEEAISQAVEETKTACGNAELKVSVSWDQIETVAANNAEKMKSKNYESKWLYASIGERTVATLESLGGICKSDADYKEEIAKVNNLVITAKDDFSDYKSTYTLDGTIIKAETGHYMSRSASDFTGRLKGLF